MRKYANGETISTVSGTGAVATQRVVCHCLQVNTTQIHAAICDGTIASLKEVIDLTGAGRGCTACHGAIRQMLGGQCPASSSSPTCVVR